MNSKFDRKLTLSIPKVAWTPSCFSARSHGPLLKDTSESTAHGNLDTNRKAAGSSGYSKSCLWLVLQRIIGFMWSTFRETENIHSNMKTNKEKPNDTFQETWKFYALLVSSWHLQLMYRQSIKTTLTHSTLRVHSLRNSITQASLSRLNLFSWGSPD